MNGATVLVSAIEDGCVWKVQESATERNPRQMKLDAYSEIYLWNKKRGRADSCAAAHVEVRGALPQQTMKAHELRLEEIRAALNADFAAAMFARERGDHLCLNERRNSWEQQNQSNAPQ
jgi:hypothetical protein